MKNLTIVNRSDSHQLLMTQYGISQSINYQQLYENLHEQDIVLVCTSAPHYVLQPEHFDKANKSMIICDMSMPRNVDPKVAEREGHFQFMAKIAVAIVIVIAMVALSVALYLLIKNNEKANFENEVRTSHQHYVFDKT